MILSVSEARALVEASMTANGHTPDDAAIIADHLIACELRGLSYGGLPRAQSVVERIRKRAGPGQPITVLSETPVSARLDGGDQAGYLVGCRATDIAIAKARASGIAVVGASNTWYTGMFSYYLELITRAGFAGMIAGSSGQKVAHRRRHRRVFRHQSDCVRFSVRHHAGDLGHRHLELDGGRSSPRKTAGAGAGARQGVRARWQSHG